MDFPLRALVIDDDSQSFNVLRLALQFHGYHVFHARNGDLGLQHTLLFKPDLILLDPAVPGLQGLEALRALRGETDVPVMILKSHAKLNLCISALENGADDYVNMPFYIPDLMSRLRIIQRPREVPEEQLRTCGGLIFDFHESTVCRRGLKLKLSLREYRLLAFMAHYPHRVLTLNRLLAAAWHPPAGGMTDIRICLNILRQKIRSGGVDLRTDPGIGYRLIPMIS